MYTGERQVSTLRKKYLEAVLKQDVGFFDTDARTGDIVFSVSTDTLLVQDAISEKVLNLNNLPSFCFFFSFTLLDMTQKTWPSGVVGILSSGSHL